MSARISDRPKAVDSGPSLRRSERISLGFVSVVAAASALAFVVSAGFRITDLLTAPQTQLSLSTSFAVPPEAASGSATLIGGSFATADVTLEGLNFGSRALLAGGTAVAALMYLIVAASIVLLCVRLIRAAPFGR